MYFTCSALYVAYSFEWDDESDSSELELELELELEPESCKSNIFVGNVHFLAFVTVILELKEYVSYLHDNVVVMFMLLDNHGDLQMHPAKSNDSFF